MKAYQIPNFLNKKIRRKHWDESTAIKLEDGFWVGILTGAKASESLLAALFKEDDWEEYIDEEQWYRHEVFSRNNDYFEVRTFYSKEKYADWNKWSYFSPKEVDQKCEKPGDTE